MPDPDEARLQRTVRASRMADAAPSGPIKGRADLCGPRRQSSARLAFFLFVASWFALIGLIATLRWLAETAAPLLKAMV